MQYKYKRLFSTKISIVTFLLIGITFIFSGCWTSKISGERKADEIDKLISYCQDMYENNVISAYLEIYDGDSSIVLNYTTNGKIVFQSLDLIEKSQLKYQTLHVDESGYYLNSNGTKLKFDKEKLIGVQTMTNEVFYNTKDFVASLTPNKPHTDFYMQSTVKENWFRLKLSQEILNENLIVNMGIKRHEVIEFAGDITYRVKNGKLIEANLSISVCQINLGVISERTVKLAVNIIDTPPQLTQNEKLLYVIVE